MDWLLLISAPFIGLLVGLMPALGATLLLILMYPWLVQFDVATIIMFYAIMVGARDFSGSVSALNFGLLGEVTSVPILKERNTIVNDQKNLNALRNTMLGSLFGVAFGMVMLWISVAQAKHYPWLLRSDVIATMLALAVMFLSVWKGNKVWVNCVLMLFGFFLGKVGFDAATNTDFLVFGNMYLSGGIPVYPVMFGLYAMPMLYEIVTQSKPEYLDVSNQKITSRIKFLTLIRSGTIGSICGIIPFVGTTISSQLAYNIEHKFYPKENSEHALARVSAAETSNNAGQVTMLIPLLVLGIAVQSSEVVLINIASQVGWDVESLVTESFMLQLMVALVLGALVSGIMCYNLVLHLTKFFVKYFGWLLAALSTLFIINILHIGSMADQLYYYAIVFVISLALGLLSRKYKIDHVPTILILLLFDSFDGISRVLYILYLA
jgi:putative tricarboxylic transport membrane protein|tara:strand:+ start:1209 stop:2516 length:1308 start_codon:yes stop_codon:yes gene_type:complete